jgi:hypothetical protein
MAAAIAARGRTSENAATTAPAMTASERSGPTNIGTAHLCKIRAQTDSGYLLEKRGGGSEKGRTSADARRIFCDRAASR